MTNRDLELGDRDFSAAVLESDQPVLVDFWAEWCAPCRMVAPVVKEISEEYEDKLQVTKINVDENQDVALEYGIRSIPTLAIFKDGEMVERIVGFKPKEEMTNIIDGIV